MLFKAFRSVIGIKKVAYMQNKRGFIHFDTAGKRYASEVR
jgi:hypothetical protein